MLERWIKKIMEVCRKEDYDGLKDKWMKVYYEIKHQEKNPLLMSYEDIQKMY